MNGNATPAAIRTAISTLDHEFGDVENLRFNQVITRLQQTLDDAEINLAKVLGNVMTLRGLPPEKLGPDPLPSPQSGGGSGQSTGSGNHAAGQNPSSSASTRRGSAPPTGMHAVFADMLQTIVAQLRHRGDGSHGDLLTAIAASPEVAGLGSRVVQPLADWAGDPDRVQFAGAGTDEQYRVILHVVYVWLCGKLGPVQADRTLASAVRSAETLPEAVANPPRRLL